MSGHPVAVGADRLVAPSRYRHPGDVIRLIAGGVLLVGSVVASAAASRWLLGPAAPVAGGPGPASQVLTGLVQVACVAAAALIVAVTLSHRQFGLLGRLVVAGLAAAGLTAGILVLLGDRHPDALADNLAQGSWLASAAFPSPALIAGAAAVIVAGSPQMSRPWRRAAWLTLLLVVVVRILTGTVLPMEVLLAIAAGVIVGAGVLVAFGAPDRWMGPSEVARALRSAGVPAESVRGRRRRGQGLA